MSILAHPAVEAALQAVADGLRRLPVYPDQIRKLVRVEITETIRKELYALRDRHEIVFPHFAWGPITICGISFYMVDALPDPGWRVIGIPD